MSGDGAITADLMARLRRHYIKPSQPLPGGVFLPEVGWNGGVHQSRADALYVGFTSSSGRMLIGHEVKASRSDWLTELAKPGKADAWADQCHEWWLVTIPGVVREGELPDGWGLMLPGTSTTRMKIVTPARRHFDRQPSWDAMRSIIARQDTLRATAIAEGQRAAREAARLDADKQVEQRVAYAMAASPDAAEVTARLTAIETALGARLVADDKRWRAEGEFYAADLADVAALLRTHRTLEDSVRDLASRYATRQLDHLRTAIDLVQEAHDAAIASLPMRKDAA